MASYRSLICSAGMTRQLPDADQLYSEPWQTPTLQNGWQSWNTATFDPTGLTFPGYRKDPYGTVYLQGVLTGGTLGTTVFTLPAGYRPNRYLIFPIVTGSTTQTYLFGVAHVKQDGSVLIQSGGTYYAALDPIQFRLT